MGMIFVVVYQHLCLNTYGRKRRAIMTVLVDPHNHHPYYCCCYCCKYGRAYDSLYHSNDGNHVSYDDHWCCN
jgi:hypothetical protein